MLRARGREGGGREREGARGGGGGVGWDGGRTLDLD